MSKRRKSPAHTSAWSWLCGLARNQAAIWNKFRSPRPAERIVSQLEECRGLRGFLYPPMRCDWSRLVRWQGELLLSGASSANPLIERVYARERAQLLARQLARGPLIEPKPEIGEPDEPEEPETFTLLRSGSVFASPWPAMRSACDLTAQRLPGSSRDPPQSQQF